MRKLEIINQGWEFNKQITQAPRSAQVLKLNMQLFETL